MQHPAIDRLRALSAMPVSELRSRANALPELLAAITAALSVFDGIEFTPPRGEESSPETASLAGRILNFKRRRNTDANKDWNELLDAAHSLAGSVMTQAPNRSDPAQTALPLEDAATRSLIDAQSHGQAHPLTRTVEVGPDSTGKKDT